MIWLLVIPPLRYLTVGLAGIAADSRLDLPASKVCSFGRSASCASFGRLGVTARSWDRVVRRSVSSWIAAAALVAAIYFAGYKAAAPSVGHLIPTSVNGVNGAASSIRFVLHDPVGTGRFGLAALGTLVPGASPDVSEFIGGVILIASICVIVHCFGERQNDDLISCLPVALIAFGLLFEGLVTLGRSQTGITIAMASRFSAAPLVIAVALLTYSWRRLSGGVFDNAGGERS